MVDKMYADKNPVPAGETEQVEAPPEPESDYSWVGDAASKLGSLLMPGYGMARLPILAGEALGDLGQAVPSGVRQSAAEALRSPLAGQLMGSVGSGALAEIIGPGQEDVAAAEQALAVEAPPEAPPGGDLIPPLRAGPAASGGGLSMSGSRKTYGAGEQVKNLGEIGQELQKPGEKPETAQEPVPSTEMASEIEQGITSAMGEAASMATLNDLNEEITKSLNEEIERSRIAARYKFTSKSPDEIRKTVEKAEAGDATAQKLLKQWEEPDPNRWWKRLDTGDKVMAAIAIGLSSFGSSITGAPNNAIRIIMGAIDKDVEAQMEAARTREETYKDYVKQHESNLDRMLKLRMAGIQTAQAIVNMGINKAHLEQDRFKLGLMAKELQLKEEETFESLRLRRLKLRIDNEMGAGRLKMEQRRLQLAARSGRGKPHAEEFNLVQVQAARERLKQLEKQYNALPPLAVSLLKGWIPGISTDEKEYNAAKKIAGRFIYRQILKDRMSNVDAQWAEEALMGSPYEPREVGRSRFQAAMQMIDDIYEGKMNVLSQYGIVGTRADGKLMIDRDTMKAYFDQVAAVAEGG